ncbi:MAG: glycine--tRNA ligase [Candidatus Bilamarchaeaceae archaeon]
MEQLHERLLDIGLNRSFFFPSNEIYETFGGFYDYGPVGVRIKKNIEDLWRKLFVFEPGFHEMETSIVTPEIVLKASGHVASFADPVFECKACKSKIRADTYVEKEIGDKWDGKLESLDKAVQEHHLKCPSCKKGELSKSGFFNMMFKTEVGGDRAPAYSRPETAQGIFVNFPRVFRNHGSKLPMAIAQIGKSFRNEISPRKGLVRMREFTQMELEYFFNPSQQKIEGFDKIKNEKIRMLPVDAQMKPGAKPVWKTAEETVKEGMVPNEIMAYFLVKEWEFYKMCGMDENRMWFRVLRDNELPHYSKGNVDLEVETSYGIIETIGNAYRTDFDLGSHGKLSGKPIEVFVEEEKKKITPHVFELSMGVDRMFFCLTEHTFREKSEAKDWEWFDFPTSVSPYVAAVFPLMKKEGLDEKAKEVSSELRKHIGVIYQETGSIGKRYARADEIGIPYCVTVDYQTMEDKTVTIRYRNDGKQVRVKVEDLAATLEKEAGLNKLTV